MSISVRSIDLSAERIYNWYTGKHLRGIAASRLTTFCEGRRMQTAPITLSKQLATQAMHMLDRDAYVRILKDQTPLSKPCTVINDSGNLHVVDNIEAFVFLHLQMPHRVTMLGYVCDPVLWRQYLLRGIDHEGVCYFSKF